MNVEQIAEVCHEANAALCRGLGDDSQPAWADAPNWQRESAVNSVQFQVANPEAPASASHESWLAEKAASGWSYGEVKDPEAKTHPCFVPYDQLPKEQQAKDHLFKAIVQALAPLIGV